MSHRAVIMDLGGVLFGRSSYRIARHLTWRQLSMIALTSCDMNLWRTEFFQLLDDVAMARPDLFSAAEKPIVTPVKAPSYEGVIVPALVAHWMRVPGSSQAILDAVDRYIDDHFGGSTRASLMKNMARMAFDPVVFADVMRPMRGWELMRRVRRLCPGVKLYLISNYNGEAYETLARCWPDLFVMFSDVIISGKVGVCKPDRGIFDLALKQWQLRPEECVFIDDTQDNIDAARALGFMAHLYRDKSYDVLCDSIVADLLKTPQ